MSTHAAVQEAHGHGGGPRIRINRFGLWLFFISDALLFGIFGMARFYVAGTHTPESVSQLLGVTITSILLLSSFAAYRAETAILHGNIRHGRQMLLVTAVLGMVFLGGVIVEWSIAKEGPQDAYGTALYSMTGMHATHVASGIIFLLFGFVLAGRGRYNNGNTWGSTAIVMYWHFVDIVWVFFYPLLYLIK